MSQDFAVYSTTCCDLAEGPLWCAERRVLYWHDVTGRRLHLKGEQQPEQAFDLPKMPGCFGFRAGGGLIAAFRNQLALYDPDGAGTQVLDGHGIDFAVERFNDGACDAQGRFWVGSFEPKMAAGGGSLYRIDPDLSVHRLDTGINMANGIAWSPDNRFLYFADSRPGQVYRYEFDLEAGTVGPRTIFLDYSDRPGRPDGCTVDSEGFLWVAEVMAGRVSRYDPSGERERMLPLPVSKPTSLTFGGEDLRTLFITTMRYGLSEAELKGEPLAGSVLSTEVDIAGQAEHCFAGPAVGHP